MKEERLHHHRPTGAIILIGIGLLFLLNNFGILPFSVWFVLWRFWPVLLVLLGLRILLGRDKNHEAFTFISLVIILAILVLSVATVNPGMRSWMQSHMSWFPMNQMMQQNQMPQRMYNRRYWMYNNNGNSQNFDFQTPNNF